MSIDITASLRVGLATKNAASELQKLRGAATALETSFVKQMLAEMRKATPSTADGKGFGGDMYRDMFDDALAAKMTDSFHLGIANDVMRHSGPQVIQKELARMDAEARAKTLSSLTDKPVSNEAIR